MPAYGFERIIDPPPLEVNSIRLLSEQFHAGSLTLADTWRRMLDPVNAEAVLVLAKEAGTLADAASRRLGLGGESATAHPSTLEMAEALASFHFPDDLWARVIYDLVLATRRGVLDTAQLVAALVPVYFGRVGSFVIENRQPDHGGRRGARGAAGARVRAAQAVPGGALGRAGSRGSRGAGGRAASRLRSGGRRRRDVPGGATQ